MNRRTIKVGVDRMLEVELHSHGWEITILDRNGIAVDMWIEPNVAARNVRIEKLAGTLGLAAFT